MLRLKPQYDVIFVILNVVKNLFVFLICSIAIFIFLCRQENETKETPDLNFIRTSFVIILHRVSELVNLQIFYMLVNLLKHLNNEQNKTMMVHYVKVEFYSSIVKSRHYEERNDEVIQYKYNNKK